MSRNKHRRDLFALDRTLHPLYSPRRDIRESIDRERARFLSMKIRYRELTIYLMCDMPRRARLIGNASSLEYRSANISASIVRLMYVLYTCSASRATSCASAIHTRLYLLRSAIILRAYFAIHVRVSTLFESSATIIVNYRPLIQRSLRQQEAHPMYKRRKRSGAHESFEFILRRAALSAQRQRVRRSTPRLV